MVDSTEVTIIIPRRVTTMRTGIIITIAVGALRLRRSELLQSCVTSWHLPLLWSRPHR
jgi:hypothetical protein